MRAASHARKAKSATPPIRTMRTQHKELHKQESTQSDHRTTVASNVSRTSSIHFYGRPDNRSLSISSRVPSLIGDGGEGSSNLAMQLGDGTRLVRVRARARARPRVRARVSGWG